MLINKLQLPDSSVAEHAEQLGRLKQQVELLTREKESLKESLDQKEKEVGALTKAKAVLEGQLKEVMVDKQSLGELTGKLASSTSEISSLKKEVDFLQSMLKEQLSQPEQPSHPPPPPHQLPHHASGYPYPLPPPTYPPPPYPPWAMPPQPPPVQPPTQAAPAAPAAPSPAPAPVEAAVPVPAVPPPQYPQYPYPYGWPAPANYGHQPR